MDRDAKKKKILELVGLIAKKNIEIEELKKDIKALKVELEEEKVSEIPILMFCVDENTPYASRTADYRYKYIYYCPDTDEVKRVIKNFKNDFLPNTVDLREIFSKVKTPVTTKMGDIEADTINKSISVLKKVIDDLFQSNAIDSWSDLAAILTNICDSYKASKYLDNEAKNSKLL